jgi:hypothetical protein
MIDEDERRIVGGEGLVRVEVRGHGVLLDEMG